MNVGLATCVGTTIFGAGGAAAAGGRVGAFAAGVTASAAGFASTTEGGAGRAGGAGAAGDCLLMIALRTSPGLEMLERSILVLISSESGRLERDDLPEVCASLEERK